MEYIQNPTTTAELQNNVQFQLDNVLGWLSVRNYENALIKAECLVSALQALVDHDKPTDPES